MDRIPLTKISQIIQSSSGNLDLAGADVSGISIDSRTTQPGDLFFAIQGTRFDAHQFLDQALSRGASACVVKQGIEIEGPLAPLLQVPGVNQALSRFAHWYRRQQKATVIGVTGSVGKTTTRNMIYTALASYLNGVQSPANYNNEFGVPLSLSQLEETHEFAVLELGASQCGEIRELAEIARPEIGIITGIAPSHLEHFGTLQRTAEAKGELFEQLSSEGLAIVNGDDSFADFLVAKSRAATVKIGLGDQNDLQALNVNQTAAGVSFQLENQVFRIPVPGKHFVYAALTAIAVGKKLGLTNQQLAESLCQFEPVSGRCRVEQWGDWTVIDDTYNANPVSMQAACDLLGEMSTTGKRILVIGDMLELGPDTERYHRELGQTIAASKIDWLFACGAQAAVVAEGALGAGLPAERIVEGKDVNELQSQVFACLEPGDVVLAKGSRGMRMEQLISYLKTQTVERAVLSEKKTSCV